MKLQLLHTRCPDGIPFSKCFNLKITKSSKNKKTKRKNTRKTKRKRKRKR